MLNRRRFIQTILGAGAVSGLGIHSCQTAPANIPGKILGASATIGHLLRENRFPPPVNSSRKKVVIIGGGVSGLSAARYLVNHHITDLIVLDLENNMGGNAAYGENKVSAFPLGAHYIPVPNNELKEYISFLNECDVITGFNESGLPSYNEYYLCFDSQERLFLNGQWQDSLIPHHAVPPEATAAFERFLAMMETFRNQKGNDGKYAFDIPVNQSSKDIAFTQLDTITMKEWLELQHFTSEYIHWYVNYCCRDDFGTPHHLISAWAGIHYFAARKGKGDNAGHNDVLTWPEGNGFLINALKKKCSTMLKNNALVTRVQPLENGVQIEYFETESRNSYTIEADHCIMAVPQFVAARLLKDEERKNTVQTHFHYCPWLVANLLVGPLEEKNGVQMSWDNVIYNSKSLGYVDATHQLVTQPLPYRNITYYLPLLEGDCISERKAAQLKTHAEWTRLILDDLEKVHPDVRNSVKEINIMLWGHAMVQPVPGMIHGKVRTALAASVHQHIHFAHTDLAGISIFEEGFYQGINAAQKITGSL